MIKLFKIVSFLEGVSYVLLLFFAVPFKYFADTQLFVKILGMPHGILFLAYIVIAVMLKYTFDWTGSLFFWICLLAIIPFGTFFVGRYLQED